MGKKVDLTGQVFGRLTVLERAPLKKGSRTSRWTCRCECGSVKDYFSNALKTGATKSCGCVQKERIAHSMIGRKIGLLKVIERVPPPEGTPEYEIHNTFWRCRCDCGNEIVMSRGKITSLATPSCGCAKERAMKKVEDVMLGKRFGMLTVLERSPPPDKVDGNPVNTTWWRCMCDCGREVVMGKQYIKTRKMPHCGCKNPKKPKKSIYDKTCEQCKKEFDCYALDMWAWKIGQYRFCTYGCMRKWERSNEEQAERETLRELLPY